MDGSSLVCLLSYCATSPIGLHYPLTFMPQRHNKFSMPHGEKGGGEEGGRRDGMELPGRYIGGIFQIYYPLICYIGGKEGELHYFFVVPSYVKFVGSFIHTGSSGLYIHLHTTSLPLFLFRHSLRRRVRCEISKILRRRGVPYLSGSQCPHLARVAPRQIPRASQICQIRR